MTLLSQLRNEDAKRRKGKRHAEAKTDPVGRVPQPAAEPRAAAAALSARTDALSVGWQRALL